MAASDDQPGPRIPASPQSELSTRGMRVRAASQYEFETEFYGRILEHDPHHVDVLRAQANNFARRGELGRALALDRRLVRLRPERPIPWYNLACSYSLLGLIGPALHALGRALDLGYPRPNRIFRDPDLKAVRRDPRFGRLIERRD